MVSGVPGVTAFNICMFKEVRKENCAPNCLLAVRQLRKISALSGYTHGS